MSKQTARKPTPYQVRVLQTLVRPVIRPAGLPDVEAEAAPVRRKAPLLKISERRRM